MEVLKSLLLLWCFQELIQCYGDNRYCADQVEALRVKAGDTVTIPCRISYPKDWDEHTTVSVSWRETNSTPCGNARFIYNHTDKWTDDKYKGRLSIVGNWNQHKEASLIIQELKTTDGPRFCCRVEIKNKEREQRWQNSHTTLLRFQEHRHIYVKQLDAVPALQGENITIPCRIHNLPANKQELKEVIWRLGNSELCTGNKESITEKQQRNSNSKYSVVDFPNDVSLHIKDVRPTDKKHYCCEVTVGFERVSSIHGTQLGVEDSKSDTKYFVHQPQKASATKNGSVTIPCSFNSTNNNDPLWVGIYWRVGSLTGPYAYHPSQEFISSTYMGRTQLMGQGDLHIQGLQKADSTSYYCIVMLRFCIDNNKYDSVVAHGNGTTLNVAGPENNTGLNTITIIIICLVVLIIATVIFGILIFLRKKGKICKTESNTNTVYATADMPMRTQPSTTNTDSSHEMQPNSSAHEESGGVLYADLKIKPGNKINVERLEDNDPQVLYSAVKPKMHHN